MIEVQLQAARAVMQVLGGRSLRAALPTGAASAQRGAVQDIAFGVMRHLGLLRAILGELADKRVADADLEALLLVALYQLEFTRAAPHAIVDHAVRATGALRKASARGLVNAVLRSFLRHRECVQAEARRTEVGRFSYPQWWIDAMKTAYPQRFADILDAGNVHPPMTLRVNLRKIDCESYLRLLHAEQLSAEQIGSAALLLDRPVPVERLPGFEQGLVSVQDLSAQYAAQLLDLRPGQRVLDACAAPGGKTGHICESCHVELVAVDGDTERLRLVAGTLQRLSLQAKLVHADAADLSSWWDGAAFDRILLDAPCTASGIVRRRPDIKWLRRSTDIGSLAAQQQRLLDALWHTLAPGGKFVYATCSVFPEETFLQLPRFLQAHPDARRLELSGLPEDSEIGNIHGQILPDLRHDGFFYALLQKN